MVKKIIVFIFILIITFSLNLFSFAEDSSYQFIKIGLRSGSSAVATTSLTSDKGFIFGYYSNNEFIPLFDLNNRKEVCVRKDSYYLNMEDYFFEYDFDDRKDSGNADITGPIHIQLGASYASKTEALDFADSIKALGIEPYLALEGKWKVWVGAFTTYDNAEKYFDELKSLFSNIDMTVISKNSRRIQVTDQSGKIIFIYTPSYGDYVFQPKEDALIAMDNKLFRGEIIFKNASNGNLTVINQLKMDEYLYGVLPKEISVTAPVEALKAQAVAARNYAVVNRNKHREEGFDLCSTTHCQSYGGFSAENQSTSQAVDETKGLILAYNGIPISTFYHMDSGGHTENSENVWGQEIGYIRGVTDDFGETYTWEQHLSKNEIVKALNLAGYSPGEIRNIYINGHSEFGSVSQLIIQGSENTVTLEKDYIRKVLGYNIIKSLKFSIMNDNTVNLMGKNSDIKTELIGCFTINEENNISRLRNSRNYVSNGNRISLIERDVVSDPDTYVFLGTGYGHALGMSQKGAIAMARSGYTFKEILYHYYTGVELISTYGEENAD